MLSRGQQSGRKTGVDILGDVPWGTHFCLFYETEEDLIDILVPYFKAGLESNEFCMWVTSEPLTEKRVKDALRAAIPDFDRYLETAQIEIISHDQWYLKEGVFELQRALRAWIDKIAQAISAGFDGIRVTGNTGWLEAKDWKCFADYEKQVDSVIDEYQMLAICSYPLSKCGVSEILDVISSHGLALIRREGKWELIESTERKKAEVELKQYRFMVESARDAIFFKDLKSRYIVANNKTLEAFGLPCEQVIGKNDYEIMLNKEEARKNIENDQIIFQTGKPKEVTKLMTAADGTQRWFQAIKVPQFNEKGDVIGLVGIARDITEHKQMEDKMRESEKLASKGQLAAQIAHEINNPLAGIKNSFLLIKDAIPEDHPYYRYVGLIDKEIERISDIVRQMFDLYRPNQDPTEFSVNDAIHEVVALLEADCHEHNVVISIDSSDKALKLPEALLRQVLFNIVKNAVEASPPGAEVKIAASVTKDALTLTVSDHGSGIPEQVQTRIFEPSFTTKDSQTMGLGLGLAVSKNIVEGMGGSIHFESKADEGTVFSIVIPLSGARKEV